MTHDQSHYFLPTASADGSMLSAVRTSFTSRLWTVPVAGGAEPRPVPIEADNPAAASVTADGTLVFIRYRDDGDSLWAAGADGTGLRQVTPPALAVGQLMVVPGTNAIVIRGFGADRVSHLWRVDADGTNLVQLTRGAGETLLDVSAESRECLFLRSSGNMAEVWKQPLDGTTPGAAVARGFIDGASFSPDGTLVAHTSYEHVGEHWIKRMAIVPRDGGNPVGTLVVDGRMRGLTWAGDSAALAYVTQDGGAETLVRWPVAGGKPTPLLRFRQGRIDSFRWSRDGRTLFFTAATNQVTNLWTRAVGAAEPRQITRFPTGSVRIADWSPDGKTVYFNQGHQASDIVLIRGIK
jgi:WD40 repeat protein